MWGWVERGQVSREFVALAPPTCRFWSYFCDAPPPPRRAGSVRLGRASGGGERLRAVRFPSCLSSDLGSWSPGEE